MTDYLTPKRAPLWLHIAAGVFIGTIAAAFVIWRVAVMQAQAAAAEVTEALRQSSEQTQQAQAAADRTAAQAEALRRQQQAERQRNEAAERQRLAAETERRELAWTRFYKKPTSCDESRGGSWTVDCANDYIRAKKRFAELYDAGKL